LNQLSFDLIDTEQDCFVYYTEVRNYIKKAYELTSKQKGFFHKF